jgi:hypothetical protein
MRGVFVVLEIAPKALLAGVPSTRALLNWDGKVAEVRRQLLGRDRVEPRGIEGVVHVARIVLQVTPAHWRSRMERVSR